MAKISKKTTTIALDSKEQNSFVKVVKKIKKKVKKSSNEDSTTKSEEFERGLIYLSHIPHGFYEDELKGYFQQFGKVTNVRVLRSKRTGRSKGAGYVEFEDSDVGKIAAETMNNYLMFRRRIEAKYVPAEERHKNLFKIRVTARKYPGKKAVSAARAAKNKNVSRELHEKKIKALLKKLHKAGTLEGVQVTHLSFTVDGIDVNTLEIRKEKKTKIKVIKKKTMKPTAKKGNANTLVKRRIEKLSTKRLAMANSNLVTKIPAKKIQKRKTMK